MTLSKKMLKALKWICSMQVQLVGYGAASANLCPTIDKTIAKYFVMEFPS